MLNESGQDEPSPRQVRATPGLPARTRREHTQGLGFSDGAALQRAPRWPSGAHGGS